MNRPDDVTLVQRAMEFCLWRATRCDKQVGINEVMKAFGCSRATAFRWVRAYRDATLLSIARPPAFHAETPQPCTRGNA